ncbi:hypothetical protein XFF6992_650008 [Xanthomonas citri pv. fuscans]|nr:hypothetical protein XFF6992_650008 [Xanthomonas citri pv. fuscans]
MAQVLALFVLSLLKANYMHPVGSTD